MSRAHSALREQASTALQAFPPLQLVQYTIGLCGLVGQPFERMLETAAQEHMALIVLGTHGRMG